MTLTADAKTKINKHFDVFTAHFNTDEAYHLMAGYLAALLDFGLIRFEDYVDSMNEVKTWYGAEVCKL